LLLKTAYRFKTLSLFSELKRRNVIRVAVAYLACAWAAVESMSLIFPLFGVPDWGFRFLIIALALGFLPALIIAWVYEITPAGLIRNASVTRSSARRLDVITIGLVLVASMFFIADRFWFSSTDSGQNIAEGMASSKVQEGESAKPAYPLNSIVVLPFLNMSDDAANEYFSDGISEELLNLLSRIHELRVISRSSSFYFKNKSLDIPTVAKRLNVAHVLEGSVRKSGDRVRISVQLIDTQSDTRLWSETYDRMVDDIFAIQDEISASVVAQLKITLLGEPPTSEEIDSEAYTLYLRARYLGRQYSAEGFKQSNALYRQALSIHPNYAEAWSGLATNYTNQTANGLLSLGDGVNLARLAAEKALEINPGYAPAHANLGWIAYGYDNDMKQAARHYERALELDSTNAYIIRSAATLLNSLNRLDEAILLGEYFTALDPATASGLPTLGSSYLRAGRLDAAIASYKTALQLSPGYIGAHYRIGVALLLKGDDEAAKDAFAREKDAEYQVKGLALALHALDKREESLLKLTELVDRWGHEWPSEVAHVYAYLGDADHAFQWLEQSIKQNEEGFNEQIFQPFYEPIHDDPRWGVLLESMGCSPDQLDAIEFRVTPL